ncbi:MAG: MATE family efflux transporter [Oscillospiraceae bacterium]|nr:MATE family efflux transporter [Oscillospiraceae bacterium]
MNKSASDMCEGPLLKKIIFYTIPIILTGVLQLLFNAADLVVVGRYRGSISVGAIGATGSLINLIVNLFIGLSVGAGVTVAHALGAGHSRDVSKIVHTALPTAFISGIILTIVGVAGADTFLRLMDTPDNAIVLSTTYMRIYFCGITASMIYNFGSAILRAAGDTRRPLYYLTAAGVINVILNVFFVRVFSMDVDGVALATVISQLISAILVVRSLMKRDDACRFRFSEMKIHSRQLMQIIRIGIPAGIQGSLFAISNVLIQSSLNSFGSVVMSGNAAAQNIEGFVYTSMNSFHQTALNFTGQNYGAKKYDRIGKIMRISLSSVFITGIVLGLTAYLFARPLLGIYITDSDEAIGYGIVRITYICIPYFLCGLMDVTTGLIRGMGLSLAPTIITVLGVCGMRILWIYTVFPIERYHSPESLYISYTISWSLTFIAELIVFLYIYRKRRKSLTTRAA